jgi:hypothetical protein
MESLIDIDRGIYFEVCTSASQFVELRERHADDLIHIVIPVCSQTPDKAYGMLDAGQLSVLLVEYGRVWSGYWVVCLFS